MHYCILALLLIFICSCNSKDRIKYNVEIAIKKLDLSLLSDSSFFSSVSKLQFYKKNLYLCDADQHRLIVLDENLKVIGNYINKGKGPSETSYLEDFIIDNDIIYTCDFFQFKLNSYNLNGEYLKSVFFKEQEILGPFGGHCLIYQESIIYSNRSLESGIFAKINKNDGKIVKTFGSYLTKEQSVKGISLEKNDNSLIHSFNDHLITIPFGEAIIQIYSLKNYDLVKTIDLSFHPIFNNFIKTAKNEYKKGENIKKTTIRLFNDSYIDGNRLFLLCYDRTEKKIQLNKIAIFQINTNTEFTYIKILELEKTGFYRSFAVKENKIFAFNMKNANLEIFEF